MPPVRISSPRCSPGARGCSRSPRRAGRRRLGGSAVRHRCCRSTDPPHAHRQWCRWRRLSPWDRARTRRRLWRWFRGWSWGVSRVLTHYRGQRGGSVPSAVPPSGLAQSDQKSMASSVGSAPYSSHSSTLSPRTIESRIWRICAPLLPALRRENARSLFMRIGGL